MIVHRVLASMSPRFLCEFVALVAESSKLATRKMPRASRHSAKTQTPTKPSSNDFVASFTAALDFIIGHA